MDSAELPHPTQPLPRPGTQQSRANYAPELPLPEELQALLAPRYLVDGFLGQGGMGAVYKGHQMPLGRPVAIKILTKRTEPDDYGFEERFKREAYAMAAITHPNIVQVYDCGDVGDNFLFISMELVEGGDLSDALKDGRVTPEVALRLIPQICDGLQAAHDRGIIHRDIKPPNIFLTKDGRAKVADFGLAKGLDVEGTMLTKAGLGMGTPDYAAPEQYDDVPDLDHRVDIYALGVMMYQMLTGRLPRGTSMKLPSQIAGVDARIDYVVAKAMAAEREERYQSAAALKAALGEITASGSPAPAAPLRTGAVPVGPPSSGRPATAGRPALQPVRRTVAAPQPAPVVSRARQEKTTSFIVMGVAASIVVGLGVMFMLRQRGATNPKNLEVDTTLEAPNQESVPSRPSRYEFPPGKWVRVFSSETELPKKHRDEGSLLWQDGWVLTGNVKGAPQFGPSGARGQNWGVRTKVRLGDAPAIPATLSLRKRNDPGGRYSLTFSGREKIPQIVHADGPSKREICKAESPIVWDMKTVMEIEFIAIGTRLIGRINGALLPPATDTALTEGWVVVQSKHAMRDVEVINLDGISEADALKIAGVDNNGRDIRK